MRGQKQLLATAVAALAVCAVAYASPVAVQTSYYIDKSSYLKPVKSGTKKHPVTVTFRLGFGELATPSGQRPAIVKQFKISAQGIRENTNDFKACGSSRVLQQGPSKCPRGSKIGTGYLIAEASSTSNAAVLLTCRAEVTLFNGGNHNLTIYVYKGSSTSPPACPLPTNYAINAKLTQKRNTLSETFAVPEALRHTTVAGAHFDVALEKVFVTVGKHTRKIVKHVHGKKVTRRVGLFQSYLCPANHQRQVAVMFTPEGGQARTATRLVHCS